MWSACDYYQHHDYPTDLISALRDPAGVPNGQPIKPIFGGECGRDSTPFLGFHAPIWAGLMGAQSGNAQQWYGDQLDSENAYSLFRAGRDFALLSGLAEQDSPDGVLLLDAIRDRSGWAWRVRVKASLKTKPSLEVRSRAVYGTRTAARQAGRLLLDYYVKKVGSHEVIMERLHLSRPTFYRRLQRGFQLVAERIDEMSEFAGSVPVAR